MSLELWHPGAVTRELEGQGTQDADRRLQAAGKARPGLWPPVLGLLTHLALEPAVGERYLGLARWLRDFSTWSDARRQTWQRERLDDVLRAASGGVPFYRALLAGRDPGGVSLEELPTVDKARIKADLDAFHSEGWRDMPHIQKRTGGSTGDPWAYPLDRRAWAHNYAAAIHFRERAGVRYGEPVVLLGAPASLGLTAPSWKSRLRHRLERHNQSLTGFAIDHQASVERVRRAEAERAALWYGYAGTIAAMADAVIEEGIPAVGPRAIVTTAETLEPAWRARIEAAFGPCLYDEYGCNDGGVLSQTCAHGRYHVAENISIVEILEGDDPCPPGVEGDVTVTNLHARVLPFIRYKIGDRAVLGEGPCPCGLPGRTLQKLAGRKGDRLQLPNGAELSAVTFGHVFKATPSVQRWQVVQTGPANIKVRLNAEGTFDDVQARIIHSYLLERCGPDVEVELTTTEPIERSPAGKHKVVVREPAAAQAPAEPSEGRHSNGSPRPAAVR